MIDAPLRVIPLAPAHDRTNFDSGSEPLDRYFRLQVSQHIRRRVTACFVALTPEQRIAGYYALASASLLLAHLPAVTAKRLPRYPSVPAVRMRAPGGGPVLPRPGSRQCPAGRCTGAGRPRGDRGLRLLVEAKDDPAAAFYRHHGFIALPDAPMTLFLPLATVNKAR